MNMLVCLLLAQVAAYSTYYLAKHSRFCGIRASALLSILACGALYVLGFDVEPYSLVFFGGTFVGMSAPQRFGIYSVFSSALIFTVLFHLLVPRLDGYGGALGVSAFLSVSLCHLAILLGAPRSKKAKKEQLNSP